MGKKVSKYTGNGNTGYHFYCEGCKSHHGLPISGKPSWKFNGDEEKPTFTPSILVEYGDHICHSYITDGKIRYLNDCTHHLRSRTVDLLDFDDKS